MSRVCRILYGMLIGVVALGLPLFSGCVRAVGTAGYWHTGQDGQLESNRAGFDTNDLVRKGKTPGSITI